MLALTVFFRAIGSSGAIVPRFERKKQKGPPKRARFNG